MAGLEHLLTGRTLAGRYRVERVIGRGGMGAVYQATDERLGRKVAVKVITVAEALEGEQRERVRTRFRREAASAARLPHHPNVVPVYDYGSDESLELDYLVMELLRGEDLASLLARASPPPLPVAFAILQGAAAGVAVGHRAGLIHRDVKPGNIFLVRDHPGDRLQVRVLDFGIAKAVAGEDTLATQLTREGQTPLSPGYASPEQLRNESRLTPASDVFSLGVVAYQLLTGTRPFSDQDRNRMSLGMEVPPPRVRERNPAVPEQVAAAVGRALAYHPADRFPDAGELAGSLSRALRELASTDAGTVAAPPVGAGGDATVAWPGDDKTELAAPDETVAAPPTTSAAARPIPRPPRQSRRKRRRRGGTGVVLTLAVLLVLGGLGYLAWSGQLTPRAGKEAGGEEAFPSMPEVDPPELPGDTADEPTVLDAFMLNQEGERLYARGDFERAAELFRRAAEVTPDDPVYRSNHGRALFRLGRLDQAKDELETSLRQDPTRALPYQNLADVYLARGDTARARESLEQFLQLSGDPAQREAAAEQLERLSSP